MTRQSYPWDPSVLEQIAPLPPRDDTDETQHELRERVKDVVEQELTPKERRCLEALFWERKSYRALADEWGCASHKSVWRVRKRALRKVHGALRIKWCPRCERLKSFEDFHRNRSTRSGRASYCIPCFRSYRVERAASLERASG